MSYTLRETQTESERVGHRETSRRGEEWRERKREKNFARSLKGLEWGPRVKVVLLSRVPIFDFLVLGRHFPL